MNKTSIANTTYLKFINPPWSIASSFENDKILQKFNKDFINKWEAKGIIKKVDTNDFFKKGTIVKYSYSVNVQEYKVEFKQYIHLDKDFNLVMYSK